MSLISENDYKVLSAALRRMEPATITRTLGSTEISVSVIHVGKEWPVAMAVQVRVKRGRVEWVQTLESIEKARGEIERFFKTAPPVTGKYAAGSEYDSNIPAYGT